METEKKVEVPGSFQSSCCGINQYLKCTVAICLPLKVGLGGLHSCTVKSKTLSVLNTNPNIGFYPEALLH